MKQLNPESVKRANEFLKNYGIGIRNTSLGLHFDWDATQPGSCAHDRNRLASLSIRRDGFGLSTSGSTWTQQEAERLVKELREVMFLLGGLCAIDPDLLYRD